MTRQHRWQLAALAAAASLICVAQAQIAEPGTEPELQPAPGTEIVEQATPAEAAATPAPPAEPAPAESTPSQPVQAAAPEATPRVIVSPGGTGPAVQAAPATPAPAVAEVPAVQRADVIAEAIYANEHGLIPRGELAMVHEDKGTLWAEQMAQAGRLPQQLAMR